MAGVRKRFGNTKPSEEMRHVCALIESEILQWPQVTARSMFGFRAYYRGDAIFALLPQTRALETPNSIAYKLETGGAREGAKWISCETDGPEKLRAALALLDRAYASAGGRTSHRERCNKSAVNIGY
jgi:hypothetical protein